MNKENRRKIADAARVLNNTFLFDNPYDMEGCNTPYTFKGIIDWNYCPFGDKEWTFMLSRFGYLANLATAFILKQEVKYLEKGIELIQDFIINNPFSKDNANTSYRTLDAAIRIHNWINFYQTCKPYYNFDSVFVKILTSALNETNQYLITNQRPFLALSNWGSIGYSYLAKSAIFLKDTFLLTQTFPLLEENLKYSVLADGMQFEQSPMYHIQVLTALLDLIKIAKSKKVILPEIIKKNAFKMALATLASIKPDRRQFMQADSDDTSLKEVLSYCALVLEDGIFKVEEELTLPYLESDIQKYSRLKRVTPNFLNKELTQSGNYYLRSSWKETGLVTHFKCGGLGSGHGHLDLLHLDISKGKEDILVDSGRYTYKETEERYELKRTRSHNSITVDNKDCAQVLDSWAYSDRPDFIQSRIVTLPYASYIEGTSLGYYPTIIKREILQVKDIALFIFDTITSTQEHVYTRYFHFDNKYKLVEKENYVEFNNTRFFYDLKEKITIVKTLYSKHYNQLENKETVVAKSNGQNLVLSSLLLLDPTYKMECEKVKLNSTNKELDNSFAYSLYNSKNTFTLLFTRKNEIAGIDLITSSKLKGYGRLITSFNGDYQVIKG